MGKAQPAVPHRRRSERMREMGVSCRRTRRRCKKAWTLRTAKA